MLKNTPKHVKVLYQPNLESTQNQPRFLRLKFWALVYVLSGTGEKKKKEKNIVCTQTAGILAGYVVPAV
jgi:hypothetical protein